MKKINCIQFYITDRFTLSISDLGKPDTSLLEAMLIDKEVECKATNGFTYHYLDTVYDINDLTFIIKLAKKTANKIIKKEVKLTYEANLKYLELKIK